MTDLLGRLHEAQRGTRWWWRVVWWTVLLPVAIVALSAAQLTGRPRLVGYGVAVVVALVFVSVATPDPREESGDPVGGRAPDTSVPTSSVPGTPITTTTSSTTTTTAAPTTTATARTETTTTMSPEGGATTVARIVDGDTLKVADGESVRLIGIDTPETVDPRTAVECFGSEASARLAVLLPPGSAVRLVHDVERTDRFGRTLAYIYRIDDNLFVNEAMVLDGYAVAATFPPNVRFASRFVELERAARDANAGLWSSCGGADAPATTAPRPEEAAPFAGPGGCDASYPGVCIAPAPPDLDCGDVPHGNFEVVPPDPHGFDGNYDGFGCESG